MQQIVCSVYVTNKKLVLIKEKQKFFTDFSFEELEIAWIKESVI